MVIGTILVAGASVTASLFMVQVAVVPLLFKYSKTVQRKMVFSNCLNYPRNLDYDNPSSCNVVGGRNFKIEFDSVVDKCPIKLGVWHIVPCSMFRDVFVIRDYAHVDERLFEELKRTTNTVVLYCHDNTSVKLSPDYRPSYDFIRYSVRPGYSAIPIEGNSNHRASPHRLQMYRVFQDLNFHVITFDYRGYGDSTHVRPTEKGVVEDAFHVYTWLLETLGGNRPRVLLWGHSLGTAVLSNMVAHLPEYCARAGKQLPAPEALVLEAPFNNLAEEITRHPCSKLISWLPYYRDTCVKPFTASSEFAFTTDEYLKIIPNVPILMLHSKGDMIVPYDLAVKLHQTILHSRESAPDAAPVVFHTFEKGTGLGHNNLCDSRELKGVVSDFLGLIQQKDPDPDPSKLPTSSS